MTGRTKLLMAAAAAATLGMATELRAQEEPFRWAAEMRSGQVLEVRGIVGEIRAEYTAGARAEVVAVKDGRSGDFDEVEVRVVKERDGYTVCAVYNVGSRSGSGCDTREGLMDRGRRRSIDVDVDYVVRLPAGVELVGKMVSGDIRAEDVRSQVRATTVQGDIHVSTSEKAWGSTVSGNIEIAMGSVDWDDMELKTVSGDITLWLPAGIGADLDFESLSGDIDSDFDINLTRRASRRWVGANVEGYIGTRGERSLSLKTVSGDVRLKRIG